MQESLILLVYAELAIGNIVRRVLHMIREESQNVSQRIDLRPIGMSPKDEILLAV